MNLLKRLFGKHSPHTWQVGDECYVWLVDDDSGDTKANPGIIQRLFKNGKVGIYLYKKRKIIHVDKKKLNQ